MPQIGVDRVDTYVWKIPESFRPGMKVPVIVYAEERQLQKMVQDRTLEQAVNVAMLPGIYKQSTVLPDAHEGYGFPIGGVAATDPTEGVISPGGVGYDINCGVRLMVTNLDEKESRPRLRELVSDIFRSVPSGLGSKRRDFSVSHSDLDRIVVEGAQYMIEKYGLGWHEDFRHMEEEGAMQGADPGKVSDTAKSRGHAQVGTLGSGNHFLELQKVDKIFDENAARKMGITREGQVTLMIHCGSRGYGHQICSDYLRIMERAVYKYNLRLPDRELACTPANSPEAEQYLGAFKCAVNYAFANRQAISHWVRQSFGRVFGRPAEEMGLKVVYDVCHNIVKLEEHKVNGQRKKVFVHRKGATRSFPKGHELIPPDYRDVGQPVLIPGSMGTASWVLLGNPRSMELSWGSTAHGAGRELSRSAAKRRFTGEQVRRALQSKGVVVQEASVATLVEEVDESYKNVDTVVEVSHALGIGTKVARLVPIGVAKG